MLWGRIDAVDVEDEDVGVEHRNAEDGVITKVVADVAHINVEDATIDATTVLDVTTVLDATTVRATVLDAATDIMNNNIII